MVRDELSEPLKNLAKKVGVIIVTHNSQKTIDETLHSLTLQTLAPAEIYLIDSGSSETKYLKAHDHEGVLEMSMMPNIGFSAANNMGYNSLTPDIDYVLFLNPDVILPPSFVEEAYLFMEQEAHQKVGAMTGILLGWDSEKERPSGLIDSAGIFPKWYGNWEDRGRGQSSKRHTYQKTEAVPALCGALMFCRKKALESVKMGQGQIFDEAFFCYKEDIDLSWRLREKGWSLFYVPEMIAYHVRGWNPHRQRVARNLRLMSAENELRLHLKQKNLIKITYSTLKYMGVKFLNI